MFKLGINADRLDLHVAGSLVIAALHMEGVQLVSKPYFKEADLVLNIDSIHNVGLARGKKTAYWEIDDHCHLGRNTDYYDVDYLYINSKDRLDLYPPKTMWLPQAMEPTIHYTWPFPKIYEMVFIGSDSGNEIYNYRKEVLDTLEQNFNMYRGKCQPQDYPKELSKGELIINVMPRSEGKPFNNVRFFESMAIGCLLQDYSPELDELAIKNKHYIAFESIDEAVEKGKWYLKSLYHMERIRTEGRIHVLTNHTWEKRLQTIIKNTL